MMRKSTLLFAFLLLSVPFQVKADVNLVELVKKIQPSVATVITYDKDKKQLIQGSGFFVSKEGHLITNYHVLRDAYSAEVKTSDGKKYPVKFVVSDSKNVDLIKVSVDIPRNTVRFVQVAKSIPQIAERVLVVGSPMGYEHTVSEGIVSAVRDIPIIGKILQISAPISQGSSGSPVVNMKGQVIGVATWQRIEGQNLNFAVPAKSFSSLKQQAKGKSLAEWASGISEKIAESSYKVGVMFLWTGEHEKALDNFKKAVEENNRFTEAWFYAGYCSGELGRYLEAIEAYEQAILIKPDVAEPHYNMGVIYGELGRYNEAIENLKQAIRIKPDFAEAHCAIGVAYAAISRYSEAIEAYRQAILIKPDFAEAHCGKGTAYGELGQYSAAIRAYNQAIRIKPDYAEAHYNKGVAHFALHRYRSAIGAYRQAVRIKFDYADAHYNMGLAYVRIRDRGSALNEYQILKTLDKDLANKLFGLIYK